MELAKRLKRLTLAVIFMFLAMLVLGAGGIWYTSNEINKNNAKWCDLLTTVDNPIPPDSTDPRSVSAAIKLHALRIDLGC